MCVADSLLGGNVENLGSMNPSFDSCSAGRFSCLLLLIRRGVQALNLFSVPGSAIRRYSVSKYFSFYILWRCLLLVFPTGCDLPVVLLPDGSWRVRYLLTEMLGFWLRFWIRIGFHPEQMGFSRVQLHFARGSTPLLFVDLQFSRLLLE